jgi:hypothetical protein
MSDEQQATVASQTTPRDPQMEAVTAAINSLRAQLGIARDALIAHEQSAGVVPASVAIARQILASAEQDGCETLLKVIAANRFNSALVMNALRSTRPAREPSGLPPVFGSSPSQESSDHGNGTGNTSGDATGDALANIVSRLE